MVWVYTPRLKVSSGPSQMNDRCFIVSVKIWIDSLGHRVDELEVIMGLY